MKKIWVVGKHGLLAQAFRRICIEKGLPFIATSKSDVDITDPLQVNKFCSQHPFSHVINCVAYTNVEKAEEEQEKAFLLNETAVLNLANACKEKPAKLIHFSTDYVFDGNSLCPYKESDNTLALNVYGKSKLAGEKALFSVLDDPLLLRISWLFGKEGSSFVSKMKNLMEKEKELKVVDDQIGRVTFADDVALATLAILDHSGVFHLANKGILSWYDFASEILAQLKKSNADVLCEKVYPIKSCTFSQKAKRPFFSVLDTTKIENALDYKLCGYKAALKRCLQNQ